MILLYKKMPYEKQPHEKQRPFSSTISSTIVGVLWVSLSFFWPAVAVAATNVTSVMPNVAQSQPKSTDVLLPEKSSPLPQATSAANTHSNALASSSGAVWDLADKTDREINGLVRGWLQLNPAQRRDLLAEVRIRMNKTRAQAVVPNKIRGQAAQSDIAVGLNRAQRQYRYGQSIPRNQKGTVVITAKVTHILPDGTRVTQSTVTPVPLEALRKRSANNNGSSANVQFSGSQPATTIGENADSAVAVGSSQSPDGSSASQKPRRQVFRATVRFGAGFGRREESTVRGQLTSASGPQNVQQKSVQYAQEEAQNNVQQAILPTDKKLVAKSSKEPSKENTKQGAQ